MTLAVSYVFFRHRSTPVIKASGRELSAILLLATLCSFAMTFLIASRPSPTKCGITRFMLGLTHTLAFAAIAVKTNRYSISIVVEVMTKIHLSLPIPSFRCIGYGAFYVHFSHCKRYLSFYLKQISTPPTYKYRTSRATY